MLRAARAEMRLGIFGGTFNPVHFGHLRTAEEVRQKLSLDRIIFMPSGNPPLKIKDLAEAPHRYLMVKAATESNEDFSVLDIELTQTEKSYTVDTVQRLYGIYPQDELFFILGADAFLDMPNWRLPDRLVSQVDFIIVSRPGFDMEDIAKSPYIDDGGGVSGETPGHQLKLKGGRRAVLMYVTQLGISSTDIRRLIRENKSIRYLLPQAVEKYIYEHGLYR